MRSLLECDVIFIDVTGSEKITKGLLSYIA